MLKLSKISNLILIFIIVLTTCLACTPKTGEVDSSGAVTLGVIVPVRDIVYGMRSALLEAPGTKIMANSNYIVFWWTKGTQYVFSSLPINPLSNISMAIPSGRCVNCLTATHIQEWFQSNGFKVITIAEVPAGMKLIIAGQSFAETVLLIASRGLTTFWMIPVAPGLFEIHPATVS